MSHLTNSFLACRLCGNDNENALLDLASDKLKFAADYRNMVLVMTGIQIDPEDRLFTLVCRGCIKRVLDSYEFREKARERNNYLLTKRNGLCRSLDAATTTGNNEIVHTPSLPSQNLHETTRKQLPECVKRGHTASPSASQENHNRRIKVSKVADANINIDSNLSNSSLEANCEQSSAEPMFRITNVQCQANTAWESADGSVKGQFTGWLGLVPTDLQFKRSRINNTPRPTCRFCHRSYKTQKYVNIHEESHITCRYCKTVLCGIDERRQHEIHCVDITDKVWVKLPRLETEPKLRLQVPTEFLDGIEGQDTSTATIKEEPIDEEISNYLEISIVENPAYFDEIKEQPMSAEMLSMVETTADGKTQEEDLYVHSLITGMRVERSTRGSQWNMGDSGVVRNDEPNCYQLENMMRMLDIVDQVPVVFRRPLKSVNVCYIKYTAPKSQFYFDSFAHLDPVGLVPRRRRSPPLNCDSLIQPITKTNLDGDAKGKSDNMLKKNRKCNAIRRKTVEDLVSNNVPKVKTTTMVEERNEEPKQEKYTSEIVDEIAKKLIYVVMDCEDLCSDDELVIDISADSDFESAAFKDDLDTKNVKITDFTNTPELSRKMENHENEDSNLIMLNDRST